MITGIMPKIVYRFTWRIWKTVIEEKTREAKHDDQFAKYERPMKDLPVSSCFMTRVYLLVSDGRFANGIKLT